MKKLMLGGFALSFLMPAVAHADTIEDALQTVKNIFDLLIPIFVVLAVIYFIYGLAQYILKAGDEEGRQGARDTMIWGVIALFVIVSIWGLIGILQETFDIDRTNQEIEPPKVGD